jgi:hypothetical protein
VVWRKFSELSEDQRRRAELHCLQNPSEMNGNDPNSVGRETNRTSWKRKGGVCVGGGGDKIMCLNEKPDKMLSVCTES